LDTTSVPVLALSIHPRRLHATFSPSIDLCLKRASGRAWLFGYFRDAALGDGISGVVFGRIVTLDDSNLRTGKVWTMAYSANASLLPAEYPKNEPTSLLRPLCLRRSSHLPFELRPIMSCLLPISHKPSFYDTSLPPAFLVSPSAQRLGHPQDAISRSSHSTAFGSTQPPSHARSSTHHLISFSTRELTAPTPLALYFPPRLTLELQPPMSVNADVFEIPEAQTERRGMKSKHIS